LLNVALNTITILTSLTVWSNVTHKQQCAVKAISEEYNIFWLGNWTLKIVISCVICRLQLHNLW
jgi:hypothetical protein